MVRKEHVAFYHTPRKGHKKTRSSDLGCAHCYVFPKQANGDNSWEFRAAACAGECIWGLLLMGMEMTCLLRLGRSDDVLYIINNSFPFLAHGSFENLMECYRLSVR